MNIMKGILVDLEGVIYLGENVIEGATNAIKKIKAKNIQIRYLTNTTTAPREIILKKLKNLDIPANIDEIFTPVIAANNYLNNLKISKIFLLADESLKSDFKNFVFEEKKPEAIILGVLSAAVLFFGFYPDPLFQTVNVSVDNLINNYNTDIQQNITLKK